MFPENLEILRKNLQLTVTVGKFSILFFNFYQKEIKRRALLSFVTFPIFSERFKFKFKFKKLSYMNE